MHNMEAKRPACVGADVSDIFYFFDIFSINISDASDRSEKHACII